MALFKRSNPRPVREVAEVDPNPVVRARSKKKSKKKARLDIVAAANVHSLSLGLTAPSYSLRRIDQAVCVCRRNRLVKPATLVAAGFREKAR